jgi:inner membrane protein
MDFLDGLDAHWVWIAAGLILAGLEMLVPGVYLMWLALAALATGALTFVLDLGVAFQVTNFVFIALILVFSARRMLRDRPIVSSDPLLNNRMGRLVGQTGTVTLPIAGGEGRVRHGDSEWLARGPDLPAGQRVRITGFDGGTLVVEAVALISDQATAPPDAV